MSNLFLEEHRLLDPRLWALWDLELHRPEMSLDANFILHVMLRRSL